MVMGERAADGPARSRLAGVIGSSEDAIILKDLDGIITDWNPAAERLYGYHAAEVIGRSIGLLIPPERADEMAAVLERLRRGERVEHYETVRVRKDGARLDISVGVSPLRDARGVLIGAACFERDISERRRLEQVLRASEVRFRDTFEQAAVGMAHVGLDGRWVRVNRR